MRKIKVLLIMCVLISMPPAAYGKTINIPKIKIEQAIALTRTYIKEKQIDVSRHFIGNSEYQNLHSEYQKPYWRIEYTLLAGSKGGQIIVFVYQDGKIDHGYGE